MHQRRLSEVETFANQPINIQDTKSLRFKEKPKRKIEIVDSWMNTKWASLISDNNVSPKQIRMNMTNGVLFNRSLMTSQYANRKNMFSQESKKSSKIKTYLNFHHPDSFFIEEPKLKSDRSSSPKNEVLLKKTQRYKYTMDELKLSWNKNTFIKFYELKQKIEDNSSISAIVTDSKQKLWKPQVREEATVEVITNDKNEQIGYIINGFNGEGIKQIVRFKIMKKQKSIIEYELLSPKNFEIMSWKFGQATLTDGYNIYIFGGANLSFKSSHENQENLEEK